MPVGSRSARMSIWLTRLSVRGDLLRRRRLFWGPKHGIRSTVHLLAYPKREKNKYHKNKYIAKVVDGKQSEMTN